MDPALLAPNPTAANIVTPAPPTNGGASAITGVGPAGVAQASPSPGAMGGPGAAPAASPAPQPNPRT